MFIRRDGSVQGPLWPRAIKDIVIEKFTKVSYTVHLYCTCHCLIVLFLVAYT